MSVKNQGCYVISLMPCRQLLVSEKGFCLCVSQVPCATMSSHTGCFVFCWISFLFCLLVCCGVVVFGDRFLLWWLQGPSCLPFVQTLDDGFMHACVPLEKIWYPELLECICQKTKVGRAFNPSTEVNLLNSKPAWLVSSRTARAVKQRNTLLLKTKKKKSDYVQHTSKVTFFLN